MRNTFFTLIAKGDFIRLVYLENVFATFCFTPPFHAQKVDKKDQVYMYKTLLTHDSLNIH